MRKTPVTDEGLKQYDNESQLEAILNAWNNPGRSPWLHLRQQNKLRKALPVLARALDRASK